MPSAVTVHSITPIMASAANTLSLDALVERYVAARGGREALRAITSLIHSLLTTGRATFAG